MPRELRGTTRKLKTKGPDGRPLWGYRLHKGKGGTKGGYRTEREAKDALAKARDQMLATRTGTLAAGLREATVADVAVMYLDAHTATDATKRNYRAWLNAATKPQAEGGLGDMPLHALTPLHVATWRAKQPARSAHYYHKALAQALAWAVKVGRLATENVAAEIPNPRPKRREIPHFGTWSEIEAVDAELPAIHRGLAVFGCGTGLMPEEWIALRWSDVDLDAAVLTVERAYSEGHLTEYGKTTGRRRRVPLRGRVVDVLKARPRGLRDALVFPNRDGDFVALRSFRTHYWNDAVANVEGLGGQTPYAMRHTYAVFSLAAGVNIYSLARRMGTSVAMIDRTYGHLAPDADEHERDLLDRFDERMASDVDDAAVEA